MSCRTHYLLCLLSAGSLAQGQTDSSRLYRVQRDTARQSMNLDAVYARPFLQYGKAPVAVGGYLEANTDYRRTMGIAEGLSFQMRRLTLFMSSTVSPRIRFLSEIEFEDGAEEINIEFAAIDFEFHPLLNLRGGIIMNPIGAFNQNHDSPKWEFVDRPVEATALLPATWSNVGFGLHGKWYQHQWVLAYESYLTNGFDDRIIGNEQNKTFLPASKQNADRFDESPSGTPLTTTKFAVRHRRVGELGISHMGGVYNRFRDDGLPLDVRRRVDVLALDINSKLPGLKTYINGEWAWIWVDVPAGYTQQYGSMQQGGFIDLVQPLIAQRIFGFEDSVIQGALRLEYVDWNRETFAETGERIFDELTAFVPGLSWRPTVQTVVRLNYRYVWQRDLLGNHATRTAAFQVGFASYF